jgi:hypothetical protein
VARSLGAFCGVDVLLIGWGLVVLEMPMLTGDIFTGPDDHLSWFVVRFFSGVSIFASVSIFSGVRNIPGVNV